MAIVKDLTIKVNGKKANVSKPIFLYLGDGAITLLIKVVEANFIIGTTDNELNIVEQANTAYARVCILKPNQELVYSNKCQIIEGKIKFEISKEFIDELAEVGEHLLQIHMYDAMEGGNRHTIPPICITILKPLCDIGHDSNTP